MKRKAIWFLLTMAFLIGFNAIAINKVNAKTLIEETKKEQVIQKDNVTTTISDFTTAVYYNSNVVERNIKPVYKKKFPITKNKNCKKNCWEQRHQRRNSNKYPKILYS